jgi:polysaccharide export outer membrane protein
METKFIQIINTGKLLLIFSCVFFFSGCYSYKNQILFQGLSDSVYRFDTNYADPIIHDGDQLSIFVYGPDDKTNAYFNMPMGGSGGMQMLQNSGSQGGSLVGYQVTSEGNIEFPKLGRIRVEGMRYEQLRDSLELWLKPWLINPMVVVRLINFRVTYITTDRAQTVTIPNTRTNILQFLGMVSGISWTDRKDNVTLIREIEGKRSIYRVDLTSKNLFDSPAFFLMPGDVIYIEPNRRKFLESNVQLVSLVTSIASTLSIFVLFINSLK